MFALHRLELANEYEFTPIHLNSLLSELYITCHPRIESAQLHCELDIPDTEIMLNVSPTHIHTALMKIVDNAVQYTPQNGTISLTYTYDDKDVTLVVSDTGIGISPDQLPHIFEMFYRGDDSRSPLTGDNGLGLTIAERIIKAHQGSIRVESTVHEGTTFYIQLPILSRKSKSTASNPVPSSPNLSI